MRMFQKEVGAVSNIVWDVSDKMSSVVKKLRLVKVQVLSVLLVALLMVVSATATAETYYFHNDRLGSPQVVTDDTQKVVWQGEYDPFGRVTETVNAVKQNLRFPGQYYDQETGLHYNYFRTYDPNTGRYVESDPIGLSGGLNTYGYSYQNSIRYTDPTGELPLIVLIPVISGIINGLIEEIEEAGQCDASNDSLLRAFGRGFVAGSVGSLVGMGAFALTGGNVMAAGGAAGAGVDQAISGNYSLGNIAVSAAIGSFSGPMAQRIVPRKSGRPPKLTILRGVTNMGRNSGRMIAQDSVYTGIAGGIGTIAQPSDGCDCN